MPVSSKPTRIGLLGSGAIGQAIQDALWDHDTSAHTGIELDLVRVFTRTPTSKRWYESDAHRQFFTSNVEDVIADPSIDIVVEVLGTSSAADLETFSNWIIRALRNGKDVVTSDKTVLAKFGRDIAGAAERTGRVVRFEAAVGGGIPIIRALRDGLRAGRVTSVCGIVNGTCNYILSAMQRGATYDAALQVAKDRSYAEPDPTADVSGSDAEAKLDILSRMAFGLPLEPGFVLRKGIQNIDKVDFEYATAKGRSNIKHLAVARSTGGRLHTFVAPMLVPTDHVLSRVDGVTNAIVVEVAELGRSEDGGRFSYVFMGPGAGPIPTAHAVLADVCELAASPVADRRTPRPTITGPNWEPRDRISAPFYVRFVVDDGSGIVGEICKAFGDHNINVAEVWQLRHHEEDIRRLATTHPHCDWRRHLPFALTLEATTVQQLEEALANIAGAGFLAAKPVWFPIWADATP